MKTHQVALLAAVATFGMVVLARLGTSPSLRAAIRTTMVVVLGWVLAYFAEPPKSIALSSVQLQLLAAVSILAAGTSWWLYFRYASAGNSVTLAPADRMNVLFAGVCAIILWMGPTGERYRMDGVLLIAGAAILALSRR